MALYINKHRDTFRLDVQHPISFAQNIDQEISNLFSSKYANKCALNSYITNISNILAKGDLIINHTNLEADAYIDVQIEYNCMEISAGDIIPWMTIKDIKMKSVALETNIDGLRICAKVNIRSPMFNSLAVDQKVCVRVRIIKYETGSNTVCVLGSFFFGKTKPDDGLEHPQYDDIPSIEGLKRYMDITCEPVGRSREAANIKFMIHRMPGEFPDEKAISSHNNIWKLFSLKAD